MRLNYHTHEENPRNKVRLLNSYYEDKFEDEQDVRRCQSFSRPIAPRSEYNHKNTIPKRTMKSP
jgi:hypothetical protein